MPYLPLLASRGAARLNFGFNMTPSELTDLRAEIDALDERLVALPAEMNSSAMRRPRSRQRPGAYRRR